MANPEWEKILDQTMSEAVRKFGLGGKPDARPAMRSVDPSEWAARDAERLQAKRFVERERNRTSAPTPMEALSEDAENAGLLHVSKLISYLQLAEQAASARISGSGVRQGQPTFRGQSGKGVSVVRAGHATRGVTALKALKGGYLTNASAAVFPDGSRFQVSGGVGDPYVGIDGRDGYPDVVFGIPEHLINRNGNVYGNTDIGSITQNSMERIASRLVKGEPTTVRATEEAVKAAKEYLKTHDVDVLNPYVKDLVYPMPLAEHDVRAIHDGLGTPEKPLPGGDFLDAIMSGDAAYGEAKMFGKVALKSIIDGGGGVMLRGQPGTTPEKYKELRDALENYGFKVVNSPPEKHPDGTVVNIGGRNGMPEEPYVKAFESIAPRIGHGNVGHPAEDVRQAAKGGDAPEPSGNFLATDEVPESIFGFRIVGPKGYTKADLAFFKEHPEAGGYYDMEGAAPDDGSTEGAPVQADEAGDAKVFRFGDGNAMSVETVPADNDKLLNRNDDGTWGRWAMDGAEMDAYRKIRETGVARGSWGSKRLVGNDDEAMQLWAIASVRGLDEARKIGWQLREERDHALAHRMAEENGGTWDEYYVKTTPEMVGAIRGADAAKRFVEIAHALPGSGTEAGGKRAMVLERNFAPYVEGLVKRRVSYSTERVPATIAPNDYGFVRHAGGRFETRTLEPNVSIPIVGPIVRFLGRRMQTVPTDPTDPVDLMTVEPEHVAADAQRILDTVAMLPKTDDMDAKRKFLYENIIAPGQSTAPGGSFEGYVPSKPRIGTTTFAKALPFTGLYDVVPTTREALVERRRKAADKRVKKAMEAMKPWFEYRRKRASSSDAKGGSAGDLHEMLATGEER